MSGGTKAVQSALEGGESVVDVCRREFQRLTKLSYSSGGKSLRNIENNARPNKERVNGSCGIDPEIRVRLFKSLELVWAPVAAFVVNAFASAWRFHRRLNEPRPQGRRRDEVLAARGPWLATAVRGTYVWWGFLGAICVATGVIAAIG